VYGSSVLGRLGQCNLRRAAQRAQVLFYGDEIALLGPGAALDDLAPALRELVAELNIPQLAAYDLTAADVPELAAAAAKASSTRANPIDLEQGEIEEAIYAAP